jgi:hypothetical protein
MVIQRAVELDVNYSTNQRRRKELIDFTKNALLNDSHWLDMLELVRQSSNSTDLTTWAKQLVNHAPVKLDFDSVLSAIKVRV